jgi:hypothetical protein
VPLLTGTLVAPARHPEVVQSWVWRSAVSLIVIGPAAIPYWSAVTGMEEIGPPVERSCDVVAIVPGEFWAVREIRA